MAACARRSCTSSLEAVPIMLFIPLREAVLVITSASQTPPLSSTGQLFASTSDRAYCRGSNLQQRVALMLRQGVARLLRTQEQAIVCGSRLCSRSFAEQAGEPERYPVCTVRSSDLGEALVSIGSLNLSFRARVELLTSLRNHKFAFVLVFSLREPVVSALA